MKNLFAYIFALGILVFAACKKDDPVIDEPQEPIDMLVGSYNGTYLVKDCGLPQDTVLEAAASQAVITKLSETEVNVRFTNSLVGDFLQFDATLNSDTSFVVTPFIFESDTLVGNGFFNNKLNVLLGRENCVIFGVNPVLVSFCED